MKIALLTTIENSKSNLGQGGDDGVPSPLEEDARECFSSWRRFGGKLKDIPIYCMCPTKRLPSKKTIEMMKKYNVKYIEKYLPITDTFTCGYWNVIAVGMWCENNLEEDFFIHIDLDMKLIKEPTADFFWTDPDKYLAKIGIITKTFWQRDINPDYKINFETCFINSWKSSKFYHVWYNELLKYIDNKYPGMEDKDIPNFDELEEHIIDVMYNENTHPIQMIDNFQMGYWYPVDELTNEEIKNIHFHHAHVYENKEKVYVKYLRGLKNK